MPANFFPTLVTFIILSFANAFISLCVAKSKFFEPIRDIIFNLGNTSTRIGKFWDWFYELVSCPYCFSHWVSFFMILIWRPKFTDCGVPFVDYVISAFAMVGVTSYLWAGFFHMSKDKEEKEDKESDK